MILKKIVDDMMLLDKNLIRENNKVDLYDLSSLHNVTLDVFKQLTLLIRQTLVRTDSIGLPMWYGKNNTKLCFGEEEVDVIKFIPVGKVFQTYKMAISYKYSPKFKPAVAQLKMSVILDAVVHLVNPKSADVHPYGPFDAHRNDPRVFNLFSGLPHVYDPENVINQKRVDVWLDHIKYVLSDSNDTVYQFFVKYFAHLIQKPHVKTKMVPLIKGTQGCGKNSSFDIFHRFLIGPQNSLVCPSMKRITTRFNSIFDSASYQWF
ncbi:unnamed protein product [Phytophthora lilii]|uniref:Unnamed protein product n=1 Tax=Phytophthora lilii TaxID=2077276 RepID=A0A9W6YF18_9STRA|nr:unnamed protein product [Phytophthora lilii]